MRKLAFSLMFAVALGFSANCFAGEISKEIASQTLFSSPAAKSNFDFYGNLNQAGNPSKLANFIQNKKSDTLIARTSYGCSTGCSTGCSMGCSSGCSSGCSVGCSVGCRY